MTVLYILHHWRADETNLRATEDAVPLFPGSDFQKHLFDCEEHALMTERELKSAMYSYVVAVGKALEKRFPDMEFIIKNTAFLDLTLQYVLFSNQICKH